MKKYLFMLFAVVAMICSAAVFTSCGGDDDDNTTVPDNAMIVGTWVSTSKIVYNMTDYVTKTYVFTSDYKFTESIVGSSTNKNWSGTYTYNPTSKIIVLTYSAEGTSTFEVTNLTSTTATFDGINYAKK